VQAPSRRLFHSAGCSAADTKETSMTKTFLLCACAVFMTACSSMSDSRMSSAPAGMSSTTTMGAGSSGMSSADAMAMRNSGQGNSTRGGAGLQTY
jgi:hypothetical protein